MNPLQMPDLKLFHRLLVVFYLFLIGTCLTAQTQNKFPKDSSSYAPISQILSIVEQKNNVRFFYNPQWFGDKKYPLALSDLPLDECLIRLKRLTGYMCLSMRDRKYIFIPSESAATPEANQNKSMYNVIGNINEYGKYSKVRFSGFVVDGKSGEPLMGAILLIEDQKIALTTDKDGAFSVVLPVGEYDVKLRYMGYEDDIKKIKLVSNGSATMELFEKSVHINEVVISAEKPEENVLSSQMSILKMNSKTIKELPTSLGEKDIIKSLTLLPGVQSVGEFGTGFNVRGGTTDQNLILIQDVPIFNSSHVFGLTSSINPDNILNVTLIKGGIPVQYGERVSSVMDIELGSTNTSELKVKGGIGLLDARLSAETPLLNHKLFLQISGRASYSDWLLKSIPNQDLMNSSASFYDLNGLLTYNFNSSNKLTLFGYYSNDKFLYAGLINYIYSNNLASVKWNHVFGKNLAGSLMLGWSKYIYNKNQYDSLQLPDNYKVTSTIDYYKLKGNVNWTPIEAHHFNFGIESILYNLNPGSQVPYGTKSLVDTIQVHREKAVETAVYIGDEYTINKSLSIEGGLRFTEYVVLGPDSLYIYNPDLVRSSASVTNVRVYGNNQIEQSVPRLEPRLSIRYALNEASSVKLSYNRINQFINLISNTAAVSPEDVWKLSNLNTKPLQCDQFAAGYFHNFKQNAFETSFEVYYKKLDHIIDYTEGATILMNPRLELDLLDDIGYSYGTELYIKKNTGKLTGWISYTYSVARQRSTSILLLEQVNNNNYYPSTNDRPNDLVINANYHATRRLRFSALFTYSTGRPETYPEYAYSITGYQLVEWSPRNKYRLPDYDRLDLSVTLDESLRIKKLWKGNWTFSIINVYGRQNVYSTFYEKVTPTAITNYSGYSLFKIYIIGQPLPTLTYNFIF